MNLDFRQAYHESLCQKIFFVDKDGIPNNADKYHETSTFLARQVISKLRIRLNSTYISPQILQKRFVRITANYLKNAFRSLTHLRPGKWLFNTAENKAIFDEYKKFIALERILAADKKLRTALESYSLIKPDIVIARLPLEDQNINQNRKVLNNYLAIYTPLRKKNSSKPILHASISCKWTIRSDRSQNSRTEGLNLIRNRKGNTPHIMIVTAEPYPQRIASLALGTGDIDCVYHIALPELQNAAKEHNNEAVSEELDILVTGKRLRDIADLPFDLAI